MSKLETEKDIERENIVLATFCQKHRLDDYDRRFSNSPFDAFFMKKNCVWALAEVKCRFHESKKYPTIFISLDKWYALYIAEKILKISSFFLVGFIDVFCCVEIKDLYFTPHDVKRTGNKSRDYIGVNDLSAIIDFPVSKMKSFATNPRPEFWSK